MFADNVSEEENGPLLPTAKNMDFRAQGTPYGAKSLSGVRQHTMG
ncbi:hypothetical protein ATPR_0274 [Acetobacter tropicalis NBRC 101654]|uniref:Uncharacterized protein n=1 Tax=Acetobacter tropicalis NBRC 101654 TaxID=749388 RepID=F7VA75_9PROT|nr:hypothetical protein ATPR_0274 [Acetobacter tropicalis NBRC 101654]